MWSHPPPEKVTADAPFKCISPAHMGHLGAAADLVEEMSRIDVACFMSGKISQATM